MSKNKNTKMFLAGTMALSSVVAVGLPAGTADAAAVAEKTTSEQVADKIASLTGKEEVVFDTVQLYLQKNTGIFVNDTYKSSIEKMVADFTTGKEKEQVAERTLEFRNTHKNFNEVQYAALGQYVNEVYDKLIQSDKVQPISIYTYLKNEYNTADPIVREIFKSPEEESVMTGFYDAHKKVEAALKAYEEEQENGNDNGNGSGGGGGVVTPPTEPPTTTPGGGITTSPDTLEKNPQDVIDAINKAETVKELAVEATPGEAVTIPMTVTAALENKNADAVVVIASTEASYELPVSVIDGAALAKQLGVASSELNITVELTKIANQLPKEDSIGFAIEFSIKATAPNGKSVDITYLGYPVLRSIETPTALNAATSVGVRVNKDGSFTAVPTYIDGKTANLYFSANSAYTVIQNDKTFKDVDARGFWAESYIEKLASKMIINGKTSTVFAPDHSVTRGEFAALLSRGLGLVAENKNSTDFTDVAPTQAINKNGEISAVVEAGIVEGYGNGKFKPSNPITRSEAAIMISKAMDYIDSEDVTFDKTQKVSAFKDYRYISATGRPHIEKVLQADYLDGFKDNTFRSENKTTRAEASKILYNFFNSIKFIN